jgi:hypothetical protein
VEEQEDIKKLGMTIKVDKVLWNKSVIEVKKKVKI